jgi:Flp pilus assembly protein TadG
MPAIPNTRRPGLTVVESVLVLAITLLLLFGLFEYGRLLMTRQLLEHAAREGARYAIVNTYSKTTTDVQNVVDSALAGQYSQLEGYNKTTSITVYRANSSGNPDSSDSNWKNAIFGEPIGVRITGEYRPMLPSFLLIAVSSTGTLPLQVTAVMNSEAN